MNRPLRTAAFILTLITLSAVTLSAQPLPDIQYRQGARSHPFDLLHMSLDVSFDIERELVFGSVSHRLRSLNPRLGQIRLDASSEIAVSSVTVDGAAADYFHDSTGLDITLPDTYAYGDTLTVNIVYTVSPRKGLYFVKKEEDEPDGRDQIWTQGEGEDHHHWIPMYDYPNDLTTTEVRATVRDDWKVLSNGKLVAVESFKPGTSTWHYLMDKPHAPYLIMLAAGDYLVTHDTARGVPLEYWSYPDMPEAVVPTFHNTPDMVEYFEDLIGVKYPWNKYAQVTIDEFMYGGMENTTATTLNDICLVDERGILDYDPNSLLAHELAHQWFGDLVTNRSWEHLWIHESFATYLAARYMGHLYGQEEYDETMLDYAERAYGTDTNQGRSPISGGAGYTANIYGRGAFVLHMLNDLVGEELFWRSIRHFLEKHRHSVVETNDLKIAFEDVTGYNLDWFFGQWVFGGGLPELLATYEMDSDTLRITLEQTQERDSLTGTFGMPLNVGVYHMSDGDNSSEGMVTRSRVWLLDSVETVSLYMPAAPDAIVLDEGSDLLDRLTFERSPEMLMTQFLVAEKTVDRVTALRSLARLGQKERDNKEEPVIGAVQEFSRDLLTAMKTERSSWLRSEIVEAASSIRLRDLRSIIVLGLADTVARVRKVAAENVPELIDGETIAELLRPMLNDPSYDVIAEAMYGLASVDPSSLEETLRKFEFVRGSRERLARAWLTAVGSGGYDQFVDRVAWYAVSGSRYGTQKRAFETLAQLRMTTPAVREAVVNGLRAESDQTFKAALDAARAHRDNEMKDMIEGIVGQLSDERRDEVKGIL